MRVLTVQTFLESIDPGGVSCHLVCVRRDCTYMVFQLKRPSYAMLRRWGSLVKSTVLVRASRPTKNSSNAGVSFDNATKRRPLGVRWLRIFIVYVLSGDISILICSYALWSSRYLIFSTD